jgi:formylglycine-generating enzyme required for sulfatase activity
MVSPTTADIRKFLIEFFGDEELTTLSFDYFRDVYEEFAEGMSKREKVRRLIERCVRRETLPELLAALERERPEQYRQRFSMPTPEACIKPAEPRPGAEAEMQKALQPTSTTRVPRRVWAISYAILALLVAVVLWPNISKMIAPVMPTATLHPTAEVLSPTPAPPTPVPLTSVTPTPSPTKALPTSTPTLGIGSTRVSEKDGMVMVYVPAGEFLMGSADSDSNVKRDEKPQHKVMLDAYWVDRTEVTNAMFARFVEATSYKTDAEKARQASVYYENMKSWKETAGADWQHPRGPSSNLTGLDTYPVVAVSWNDAAAYCQWAGRRLPTEAEWEKAARGPDGRKYPWGDIWDVQMARRVNFADRNLISDMADNNADDGYKFTAPAGSYPAGASRYDALDMAGNVWEWVRDWYEEQYYDRSPVENPTGPAAGQLRALRGGSWGDPQSQVRVAVRGWNIPDFGIGYLGFRCARSP